VSCYFFNFLITDLIILIFGLFDIFIGLESFEKLKVFVLRTPGILGMLTLGSFGILGILKTEAGLNFGIVNLIDDMNIL